MANFAVITKVIIHNKVNNDADSVAGSYAKEVSDYLETIDDGKDIHSIHSTEIASSNSIMTVIIVEA